MGTADTLLSAFLGLNYVKSRKTYDQYYQYDWEYIAHLVHLTFRLLQL